MRRLGLVAGLTATLVGCSSAPIPPPPQPTATPDSALFRRAVHTATPLGDGTILIAGGCDVNGCGTATATALLLSASGVRSTQPLRHPRDAHTAVALPSGHVLVAGGFSAEGTPPLASTEVYDPQGWRWDPGPNLRVARGGHAAARLGGSRVLMAGGWVGSGRYTRSTEIIAPAQGRVVAGPDLPAAADGLAAAPLPGGSVLVTGGQVRPGVASGQAVVVSADGQSARPVGPLRQPRFKHASAALPDGRVLIVGGTRDDQTLLDSSEVYDPQSAAFTEGPRLVHGRYKLGDGISVLPDGRVAVGGGGPGLEIIDVNRNTSSLVDRSSSTPASFSTVSVVGEAIWQVGGYDASVRLTGLDLRIPLVEV